MKFKATEHSSVSLNQERRFSFARLVFGIGISLPMLLAGSMAIAQKSPEAKAETGIFALRHFVGAAAENMDPDELAAAIADRVPGFASVVTSQDGSVRATFTKRSGMLNNGRAGEWRTMKSPQTELLQSLGENVTMVPGQFDARELLTYKNRAFSIIADPASDPKSMVFVDINEESNRVEVGYDQALEPTDVEALQLRLVRSGVPLAALVMLPAAPNVSHASIQAVGAPVQGGSQITFSSPFGSTFVCSVGVPAIRNGVLGFVTASHCSGKKYGIDFFGPTSFNSPTPSGPQVATEAADPNGFSCLNVVGYVPGAFNCRNADVLFAQAASPNAIRFGRIWYANPSNLEIIGEYAITGTQNYVGLGQLVVKTGRTTGTTNGPVTRTCVNTVVDASTADPYVVLCATEARVTQAGGDSGGPYFTLGNGTVTLVGIVSYGNGQGTAGFSPWGQIVKDLGALTVR